MRHLAILLLAAVCVPAAAADFTPVYHPQMTVGRAAGPIVLDGRLDDPGWRDAGVADNFAEHSPGDQVRPPVETRALMTYDDEALYVAWHCFDDPSAVRATMTERDRIWRDDYVILMLDTFADQVWAFEIASNPYGVQGDLLWSSNSGEDVGYDLVFETAGGIVDDGWIVEMRIPWTSLRFPADEEQVWRVDFWRNHPRDVRGQYSWAAYDRDDPCWPCKWGTVSGIRGVRPGKGLELLPALTATQAGARVTAEDDDGAYRTDAWDNADPEADLSLSAKFAVSSSFTLDGTLNPDFSQVEADAAQIDVNSTFALSYPERRPFFQEGSDLFRTWFSTVYTRSINDPSFAFKATGRPGRTNVAYLLARDRHTPLILPFEEGSEFVSAGESVTNILRVRHSLGDQSHLGVITTDRHLDGGGSGRVLGADVRLRLTKGWQIETQVLASHTDEPDDPSLTSADLDGVTFDRGRLTAALDGEAYWGHAVYASLEYGDRDQNFDIDYWERSPRFRADTGFEPANDSRQVNLYYGRTLRFDDSDVLDWFQPKVNAGRKWNFAQRKKDEWVWTGVSARLKLMQLWGQVSYMVSNENFHGIQFDGIEALELNLQAVPASWLELGAYASTGDRIARFAEAMGREERAGVSVTLKPLDRLVIEGDLDLARSRDLATDEVFFDGYIARARLELQVSRELASRIVLQYDDFRGRWEADPLLTYRVNPFSIFYVGSTRDYLDLTGGRGGVSGWRLTDRQYFLKFQYLFQV